jgi:hypothetical protein
LTLVVALAAALMVISPALRTAPVRAQEATPSGGDGGAALSTASVMPAETIAFVAFNLNQESDQWQVAGDLLARAGFTDAIADAPLDMATQMLQQLPVSLSDIQALSGGELGLAVGPAAIDIVNQLIEASMGAAAEAAAEPSEAGIEPVAIATPSVENGVGLSAVLQPSDPEAAWSAIQAAMADQATNMGIDLETDTYRDVEIVVLPPSPTPSDPEVAVARIGDFIAVAPYRIDLQPLIETADGERDSLADDQGLTDLRAELAGESLMFAYANNGAIVERLPAEIRQYLETTSPQFAAQFQPDTLSGAVVWADDPGFRMDSVVIPINGASLPDLPDNFDPTLDERVGGDSVMFATGYDLGPSGALDPLAISIAQLVAFGMAGETPPSDPTDLLSPEAIEEQLAEAEQILGFNPRDDLLRQMSGEYAVAASFKSTEAPLGVSLLLTSGVSDSGAVESSLDEIDRLITEQGGDDVTVTERNVGDDTLHVLGFPTIAEGSDFEGVDLSVIGLGLEYGVVDDQFVLGNRPAIETFIDGPNNTLAENRQYQRVLATLPTEYNQLAYLDMRQLVPVIQLVAGLGVASSESAMQPTVDADEACAEFSSQAAAQEAFDADPANNFQLDLDFDGQACEDYFNPPATPLPAEETFGPEDVILADYSAIEAFAAVGYEADNLIGQSAILYIAEE